MLDRVLAVLLKLVITGLIATAAAVSVMSAYSGFMYLVRGRLQPAGWMLALGILSGTLAYAVGTRRADLADS
jgi:hypothetical protein